MTQNDWKLGKVVLKVKDLEQMSDFYQKVVGLTVLSSKTDSVTLGLQPTQQPLVELVKINPDTNKKTTAGLFHLALLLPSRQDLGEYLYYLLVNKFPIGGASDHGYSEALYFNDPEGNGIEIYADKPESEWDRREGGRIEGITIQMDAEGVLGTVKKQFTGMPAGTTMGHVHLTVHDLPGTEEFYTTILPLGLKSDYFGQAKFFASGDYHHHLGSNTWAGKQLPEPQENQLGMAYYEWLVPNQAEMDAFIMRLNENNYDYENNDGIIAVKDNSGIMMHVALAE